MRKSAELEQLNHGEPPTGALDLLSPIPLTIKPDNIPRCMTNKDQWVGWKYEQVGNKWTKPPYQINGEYRASTTNPRTWSSFDDAYQAYHDGKIDGIGYVFSKDDDLVGIDLDHCIEFIQKRWRFTREQAEGIVKQFLKVAYIERSVGKDGLHLVVSGDAIRCGKGAGELKFIEIYDASSPRYFTVSGHKMPSSQAEPKPAQVELNWLHEKYMAANEPIATQTQKHSRELFDARHSSVVAKEVDILTNWLRDADGGSLWREYGEPPSNLPSVFRDTWSDVSSASELDIKVFGKLSWYAVLHLQMDDERVGHTIMAVYQRWPGCRGEEGERKAQYGIRKALKSAFDEREKQRKKGTWIDKGPSSQSISFNHSAVICNQKQAAFNSKTSIITPPPFPGAMEKIVDFTLRTSPKSQPELALLSALISMSASCPGYYYLATGSMRLNLYGLGIADTGAGKDHPRHVAAEVVRKAGGQVIAKPASGQGLEDQLVSREPILMEVDEAAHLFQELNNGDASSSLVYLSSTMLRLYSASKGTYSARVKASQGKTFMRTPPREISNPMLNMLGFSTPEKLGQVLSTENIQDGMLGRMVFAIGRNNVKPVRAKSEDLPSDIEQLASQVKSAGYISGLHAPGLTGFPTEIEVTETGLAAQLLDQLVVDFSNQAEKSDHLLGKPLFARSFEKCYRIAGVLAVWDSPNTPEIDVKHVEWARDFVIASDDAAIRFCDGYLHGGQTQADADLIIKIMHKATNGELSLTEERDRKYTQGGYVTHSLVLKNSKLDKKRFDEAIAYLVDAGRISQNSVEEGHTSGRRYKIKLLSLE